MKHPKNNTKIILDIRLGTVSSQVMHQTISILLVYAAKQHKQTDQSPHNAWPVSLLIHVHFHFLLYYSNESIQGFHHLRFNGHFPGEHGTANCLHAFQKGENHSGQVVFGPTKHKTKVFVEMLMVFKM